MSRVKEVGLKQCMREYFTMENIRNRTLGGILIGQSLMTIMGVLGWM